MQRTVGEVLSHKEGMQLFPLPDHVALPLPGQIIRMTWT
jgi:hypothetical protein